MHKTKILKGIMNYLSNFFIFLFKNNDHDEGDEDASNEHYVSSFIFYKILLLLDVF